MDILAHAQNLMYQLLDLMPSCYQRDNLNAILALFLKAPGSPLPEHSTLKSASALSRFLTVYTWPVRQMIRQIRQAVQRQLQQYRPRGRRPHLQVILDLTTLEKRGKFKAFNELVHGYHGKRGGHLVVRYLVMGRWRIPWSFRVYRGKDEPSPAQLGLRRVQQLPRWLRQAFEVLVLADTAFGSVEVLHGIRRLKLHAFTRVRCDRRLSDGRQFCNLHKAGQQVRLEGLIVRSPLPGLISNGMETRPVLNAMCSRLVRAKPPRLSGGDGIAGRSRASSKQQNIALVSIALVNRRVRVCIAG